MDKIIIILITLFFSACGDFDIKKENGENIMTFNIPKKVELIDTSIAYEVAEFDDTIDYEDGTEVRIVDDIYTTRRSDKDIPDFDIDTPYETYDIVKNAGKYFKRTTRPVFYYAKPCTTLIDITTIDGFAEAVWDGVTTGQDILTSCTNPTTGATYSATYNFVEDYTKETDQYKFFNVTKQVGSDPQETFDIRLYKDFKKCPAGDYIVYENYLVLVYKPYNASLTNIYIWEEIPVSFTDTYTISLDYVRKSVRMAPFDEKQYTSTKSTASQWWTIQVLEPFDCLALGNLKGKRANVQFIPADIYASGDFSSIPFVTIDINSKINDEVGSQNTTQIIYNTQKMKGGDYIYFQIDGDYYIDGVDVIQTGSELGMILPCMSLDVGATDLEFSHDIKNFDKNVVSSISGYIDHIKGNRVVQHKGTFYIQMQSYDKLLQINKKLTEELIAIDSSDNVQNVSADAQNFFDSTKIIGRVKKIGMKSVAKNNHFDSNIPISFEFEEIV